VTDSPQPTPQDIENARVRRELADLRASRERKKAERAEQKWREENPLLVWIESQRQDSEDGRTL
jgi:hypothetical protein